MRNPAAIRTRIIALIVCQLAMAGIVVSAEQREGNVAELTSLVGADRVPVGPRESLDHVYTKQEEIGERFQQAVMMLHAGQYDYAVTALRRVLELSPQMPEAHVNMGFALLGQGHPAVARDFFLGAIELRPRQVNAYWGLAVSLEALCDLKGATGAMRTYLHFEDADNRFASKARAALWEWEAAAGTDDSKQGGDGAESGLEHRSGCAGAAG